MSFGRVSTFFDVYFERDLKSGKITETDAQEIIDNLVMKLRIVRFLRTKDYDAIFSGDPYWATWSDAGFGDDGRTLVTKTSFRLLDTLTLEHLGPGPEPNITIFWDPKLPEAYKRFCARISIDTSAIQYESDKEIRSHWGRRRRHRMLRLPDARGQADAVLRRSCELRQGPAVRHQRRT